MEPRNEYGNRNDLPYRFEYTDRLRAYRIFVDTELLIAGGDEAAAIREKSTAITPEEARALAWRDAATTAYHEPRLVEYGDYEDIPVRFELRNGYRAFRVYPEGERLIAVGGRACDIWHGSCPLSEHEAIALAWRAASKEAFHAASQIEYGSWDGTPLHFEKNGLRASRILPDREELVAEGREALRIQAASKPVSRDDALRMARSLEAEGRGKDT